METIHHICQESLTHGTKLDACSEIFMDLIGIWENAGSEARLCQQGFTAINNYEKVQRASPWSK